MILKTKEFKEVCSTVLAATDSSELSTLTETLELKTEGKVLYLNVTNKEYYASVKFDLDAEVDFHATVNSKLFLGLVKNITTESIELEVKSTYVEVKANGTYKIPLIFDGDKLMDLPVITIENETVNMNVDSAVLDSIVTYNTKELLKGTIAKPVQKMFYIDEQGCITFTSGACVNTFSLEQPVKVLLKSKLVNLFKLFKNEVVKFSLGYDPISETIIQTKVSFKTPKITLTAITECDDTLLKSVPVAGIRGRASFAYPNSVVLNRQALVDAIARLALFNAGFGGKQNIKPYSKFEFTANEVKVYSSDKENVEVLAYQNGSTVTADYEMILDINDFKVVLDGCTDDYVTLNFGNHQAMVLKRAAIANVLPECRAA